MAHTFPDFAPQLAFDGALLAVEVHPKLVKGELPAGQPAEALEPSGSQPTGEGEATSSHRSAVEPPPK
jgi:hypothetical protein